MTGRSSEFGLRDDGYNVIVTRRGPGWAWDILITRDGWKVTSFHTSTLWGARRRTRREIKRRQQ